MFICVLCCWWQMKQMGPILSGSISNFEIEFHLEMYSNRVCGIHHYVIIIHTTLLILTRYLNQISTLISKPPTTQNDGDQILYFFFWPYRDQLQYVIQDPTQIFVPNLQSKTIDRSLSASFGITRSSFIQ